MEKFVVTRLINTFKRNNKNTLAGQLLFSSFFTLMTTIMQLWVDYHKDLGLIEKQILQIKESYISSLSLSIWNMDKENIYAQLEGILQRPEISCLEAKTIDNIYEIGQKPPEWRRVSFEFPIVYEDSQGQFAPKQLGILTIYENLEYIHSRLQDRILVQKALKGM